MCSIDDILSCLEMRRAAVAEYRAVWCVECCRVVLTGPKPRREHVTISDGDPNCRLPMTAGSITDCINEFRNRAAE